jgi:hypothetical protein
MNTSLPDGKIELERRMLRGLLAEWQTAANALKQYFRERYPRLRSISGRGRRIDRDVHAAGLAIGRKTVLAKPLAAGSVNRRLLLERSP